MRHHRTMLRQAGALPLLALVVACHGAAPLDMDKSVYDTGAAAAAGAASAQGAAAAAPGGWAFAAAPACAAPVEGIGRLTERGAALGLHAAPTTAAEPATCGVIPGVVVAADLDGDGVEELVFNHVTEAPVRARVEERGADRRLVERRLEALSPPEGRPLLGLAAADISGDGALDLIGLGEGYLVVAENDGHGDFSGWDPHFWQADYPRDCLSGLGLGDLDGDGDVDASLPALDRVPEAGALMGSGGTGWVPSEDRLLRNDDGRLVLDRTLHRGAGTRNLSYVHLVHDRDNDGDQDILAYGDRIPSGAAPAAAWRNDGPGPDGDLILTNDAPAAGLESPASAMGVVAADLNDDGRIDVCVSDTRNTLDCRLSDGGAFFEGARLLGLTLDARALDEEHHPEADEVMLERDGTPSMEMWTGWGLAYADLQNDGYADIAGVAGVTPSHGSVYLSEMPGWQPDWLWEGQADGSFRAAVMETGFHRESWGYGLVSVDLFGDGFRELVVGRAEGPPEIWDNPCGAGAWITVALDGPPGNPTGIGAQIGVEAGGRRQLQLVVGQSGSQHHSQQLHFGLGALESVDRLTVRWPDGAETELEDLPVRGLLRVAHPDR